MDLAPDLGSFAVFACVDPTRQGGAVVSKARTAAPGHDILKQGVPRTSAGAVEIDPATELLVGTYRLRAGHGHVLDTEILDAQSLVAGIVSTVEPPQIMPLVSLPKALRWRFKKKTVLRIGR